MTRSKLINHTDLGVFNSRAYEDRQRFLAQERRKELFWQDVAAFCALALFGASGVALGALLAIMNAPGPV